MNSNQGQQQLWASVIGHLGEAWGRSGDRSKCDLCMSESRVQKNREDLRSQAKNEQRGKQVGDLSCDMK